MIGQIMVKNFDQLEIFEEENEKLSLLKKELAALHQRCEVLKRGMASKYNQLAKLCLLLQEENSQLKKRIDELEKASSAQKASTQLEDDYLRELFQEAYLSKGKKVKNT